MADYHINVFWSEEDGCYVADIPDLAFCSAFGDSPEEALRQVLVAKEAWLESAREGAGSHFRSHAIGPRCMLAD
jgi:predicted RNase H-like HicB family nuclease